VTYKNTGLQNASRYFSFQSLYQIKPPVTGLTMGFSLSSLPPAG
jgi:hypothetical protein